MKIHIEIDQIDNGYTVSLYSDTGPLDLDNKTIFCMNWTDIEGIINKWFQTLLKTGEEGIEKIVK